VALDRAKRSLQAEALSRKHQGEPGWCVQFLPRIPQVVAPCPRAAHSRMTTIALTQ